MGVKGSRRRRAVMTPLVRIAWALQLLAAMAAPAASTAQTWQPVGPTADVAAVAMGASQTAAPAQPGALYAILSGETGIYHSGDRGLTWSLGDTTEAPWGFETVAQLVADPLNPGNAYAANGGGVLRTVDGGAHWLGYNLVCGANDLAIAPSLPGQLYVVGVALPMSPAPPCYSTTFGIVSSSDGGATFSTIGSGYAPFSAVVVDPADPQHIFLATEAGLIYESHEGGAVLTPLPPVPSGGGQIIRLAVDSSTAPSTLIALVHVADPVEGVIFLAQPGSTGGSSFWNQPETPLPVGLLVTDIAIDRNIPGTMYISSDRGVFASTDHGNSWAPLSDGLPSLQVSALALDPTLRGALYAGTASGLAVLDRNGCQLGGTTACLQASRFQVQVTYQLDGQTATAQALQLSDDTTAFWFVDGSDLELLVKILDGGSINGDYWVFSAGLSSVAYTVTVTDVLAESVRTYSKPAGTLESFADINAFQVVFLGPPVGGIARQAAVRQAAAAPQSTRTAASGACTTGATDLCLLGARFQAQVSFDGGGSSTGAGQAIPLTDGTGAFWFLAADDYELAVKVIDGTAVNGHIWVFYGAMTNFAFTLTLTDTTDGTVRTYTNPAGSIPSAADTSAF
jgi:hypothetical protein